MQGTVILTPSNYHQGPRAAVHERVAHLRGLLSIAAATGAQLVTSATYSDMVWCRRPFLTHPWVIRISMMQPLGLFWPRLLAVVKCPVSAVCILQQPMLFSPEDLGVSHRDAFIAQKHVRFGITANRYRRVCQRDTNGLPVMKKRNARHSSLPVARCPD